MEAFVIPSLAARAAIGAGLGLIAGSFIGAASMRWPEGRSVVRGRSACDHCAAPLGPFELIPLLSWAIQRGRCRRCGARIDLRHPAIELTAGMLGAVALAADPGPLGLVSAAFGWWLLLIAIIDLEHQWLPDRLTLPLIPLGLAAAWAGFGPPLAERAAGAAIGWATLFLIAWLYRRLRGREGMGGGDPRMFGAIGAWVGALQLPAVLLGAGLLGLAAVAAMRLRGEPVSATSRLPLGSLIALAAWPAWLVAASAMSRPEPRSFSLRPESPYYEKRLRAAPFPRGAARPVSAPRNRLALAPKSCERPAQHDSSREGEAFSPTSSRRCRRYSRS